MIRFLFRALCRRKTVTPVTVYREAAPGRLSRRGGVTL